MSPEEREGTEGTGSPDGVAKMDSRIGYRYAEQHDPPEPERVTDVALTTFEHVFEVDPRLMERWVLQQQFPNWDSLRIMNSRHEHLDWMHRHFAHKVLTGSELLAEAEQEEPR